MPKLIVKVDDFHLTSKYKCGITKITKDNGNGEVSYNYYISEPPDTVSCTKSFEYALPNGSELKTMTICATLGGAKYGVSNSTINGVYANVGSAVAINLDVSEFNLEDVVDVKFVYQCGKEAHQHTLSEATKVSTNTIGTEIHEGYRINNYHESSVNYTNVYLEIEYTCGAYLYHGENGTLVPYQLYHAENGEIVPYQLFNAANGELVRY